MDKKIRSLELYYMPTCPFCRKVITWMQEHNIDDVVMHDITSEPGAAEKLVEVGGKKQVPCLFIDGKPMYESDDIIEFLSKEYA